MSASSRHAVTNQYRLSTKAGERDAHEQPWSRALSRSPQREQNDEHHVGERAHDLGRGVFPADGSFVAVTKRNQGRQCVTKRHPPRHVLQYRQKPRSGEKRCRSPRQHPRESRCGVSSCRTPSRSLSSLAIELRVDLAAGLRQLATAFAATRHAALRADQREAAAHEFAVFRSQIREYSRRVFAYELGT